MQNNWNSAKKKQYVKYPDQKINNGVCCCWQQTNCATCDAIFT